MDLSVSCFGLKFGPQTSTDERSPVLGNSPHFLSCLARRGSSKRRSSPGPSKAHSHGRSRRASFGHNKRRKYNTLFVWALVSADYSKPHRRIKLEEILRISSHHPSSAPFLFLLPPPPSPDLRFTSRTSTHHPMQPYSLRTTLPTTWRL